MKQLFLRLEAWTTRLAMAGACTMLALAASLGLFQVVTRFVLEQPAEWTEVLLRFSLIWMIFLAIPMAFRQHAMVRVDVLMRSLPPRPRRWLLWLTQSAALALMLVVLYWGMDYALRARMQSMAGLEELSMFWAYLAMPVGALFCLPSLLATLLDPGPQASDSATESAA